MQCRVLKHKGSQHRCDGSAYHRQEENPIYVPGRVPTFDTFPSEPLGIRQLTDAIDYWNSQMPDYVNLLYAEVIEDTERRIRQIDDTVRVRGDWKWRQSNKYYRNPVKQVTINELKQVRLRDNFTDIAKENTQRLHTRLFNREITLQEWERSMRFAIRRQHLSMYMFGRGGINAMTQEGLQRQTEIIAEQNRFLRAMANQIAQGQHTERYIRARANLYFEASTQSFELGKADSYEVMMPEYPANANLICGANCRCFITYFDPYPKRRGERQETEQVEAYWNLELNLGEDCCETCLTHNREWFPIMLERRM